MSSRPVQASVHIRLLNVPRPLASRSLPLQPDAVLPRRPSTSSPSYAASTWIDYSSQVSSWKAHGLYNRLSAYFISSAQGLNEKTTVWSSRQTSLVGGPEQGLLCSILAAEVHDSHLVIKSRSTDVGKIRTVFCICFCRPSPKSLPTSSLRSKTAAHSTALLHSPAAMSRRGFGGLLRRFQPEISIKEKASRFNRKLR